MTSPPVSGEQKLHLKTELKPTAKQLRTQIADRKLRVLFFTLALTLLQISHGHRGQRQT